MSYNEKDAIEELRKRMENDLPNTISDKILLLRNFLVARDFDVDKAEKMLRKHLAWRKSMQIDTFRKEFKPKEFFLKYVQFSHIGVDKEGDVVKYGPWGKIDGRDIFKCVRINHYMKHWIWVAEECRAVAEKLKKETGKGTMQFRVIIDLDMLTVGNVTSKKTLEICMRLVSIFQDNYPNTLKSAYLINAPPYYAFIFNLLKPIMATAVTEKIHVYGSSGWEKPLLEIIDADILPAFLGGNRTDPDGNPLCKSFIIQTGNFSEKYSLSDEERDFKDKSQVKQICIPRKEKVEISVDVTEWGSVIQWEFLVKNKDIGFGLFYEESEEDCKDVLPILRYDTIDGTEEGSYKCQSIGKYIIVFDNSYSWMNSKEVEYTIKVVKRR